MEFVFYTITATGKSHKKVSNQKLENELKNSNDYNWSAFGNCDQIFFESDSKIIGTFLKLDNNIVEILLSK
jgi:hypothetical protein